LPDFSWYNKPKREKIYQITMKWPQNIPNSRKIDQMAICIIHITTSSIARPSKIYPNRDFWFENVPSGNPGGEDFARETTNGSTTGLPDFSCYVHDTQTRKKCTK
jgi:hypothetical protein